MTAGGRLVWAASLSLSPCSKSQTAESVRRVEEGQRGKQQEDSFAPKYNSLQT